MGQSGSPDQSRSAHFTGLLATSHRSPTRAEPRRQVTRRREGSLFGDFADGCRNWCPGAGVRADGAKAMRIQLHSEVAQHRVGIVMIVIDQGSEVALGVEHDPHLVGCILTYITYEPASPGPMPAGRRRR